MEEHARPRCRRREDGGEEDTLGPELERARTGPALTILFCFIVCTCIKIFSIKR